MVNLVPGNSAPYSWAATTGVDIEVGPASSWRSLPCKGQWDDVPYQIIDSNTPFLDFTVVAAHQSAGATYGGYAGDMGIKKVYFACNGGSTPGQPNDLAGWTQVNTITENTRTHLFGFKISVRASDFPGEGMYELRYVVEPNSGVRYVGDSLWVYVKPGGVVSQEVKYVTPGGAGTQSGASPANAAATIGAAINALTVKENGLVLLSNGEHTWGSSSRVNNDLWLTVRADTGNGATRSGAVLKVGSDIDVQNIRCENFTVEFRVDGAAGGTAAVGNGTYLRSTNQLGEVNRLWCHDMRALGDNYGDIETNVSPGVSELSDLETRNGYRCWYHEDEWHEIYMTGTDNPIPDTVAGVNAATLRLGQYLVTESCRFGLHGAKTIRNVLLSDINEDLIRIDFKEESGVQSDFNDNPWEGKLGLISNVAGDHSNEAGHGDIIQFVGRKSDYRNWIILNFYARRVGGSGNGTGNGTQGLFQDNTFGSTGTHNSGPVNYAVINFVVDQYSNPGGPKAAKWKCGGTNGLMWHVVFANQYFEWLPHRQDEGGLSSPGGYNPNGNVLGVTQPFRRHDYVSIRNSHFSHFIWHWNSGNGTPTGTYDSPPNYGPRPEFDIARNEFLHNNLYGAHRSGYSGSIGNSGLAWTPTVSPAGITNTAVTDSSIQNAHSQLNTIFVDYPGGDLTPAAGPLNGDRTQGLLDSAHLATINSSLVPEKIVPFDVIGNARPANPSVGALELNPVAGGGPTVVNAMESVRDNSKADRSDILFTDSLNNPLKHSVIHFDDTTGDMWALVRVPQLLASSSQSLYMYYDNPTATDQQDDVAVTTDYKGIYFMRDWTAGGRSVVDNLADDWPDLSPQGTPTPLTSPFPGGYSFDGSTDWVSLGTSTGLDQDTSFTLRAMVKFDALIGFARLFSKSFGSNDQEHAWMMSITSADVLRIRLKTGTNPASGTVLLRDGSGEDTIPGTNVVLNTNDTYYVAMRYNGVTQDIILDGVRVASAPQTGNVFNNSWEVTLGSNFAGNDKHTGPIYFWIVDELVRDDDWLLTETNLYKDPVSKISVRTLESFGSTPITFLTTTMTQTNDVSGTPEEVIPTLLELPPTTVDQSVGLGFNLSVPGSSFITIGGGWSDPQNPAPNPVPTTVNGTTETVYRTETSIAQWHSVPYSDLTPFPTIKRLSVVAFHGSAHEYANSGIREVRFAIDGPDDPSQWAKSSSMELNPDTGTYDFFVTVPPLAGDSGTVRNALAIAYPNDGEPFVLPPLPVYTRFTQTLTSRYVSVNGNDSTGDGSSGAPFATIQVAIDALVSAKGGDGSGGVVYLKEGNHRFNLGTTGRAVVEKTHVIIRPDPANTLPAVIIDFGVGIDAKLVKFDSIVFDLTGAEGATRSVPYPKQTQGGTYNDYVWFHNCTFQGSSWNTYPVALSTWLVNTAYAGRIHVTGGTVNNIARGFSGAFVRGTTFNQVGEKFFRNCPLISNVVCDNNGLQGDTPEIETAVEYVSTGSTDHEQIVIYNARFNRIGGTGTVPGSEFLRVQNRENTANIGLNNVAIVNTVFDQANEPPETGKSAKLMLGGRHLLIMNSTIGQWWEWTPSRQDEVKSSVARFPFSPLGPYKPMVKPCVLNTFFERFTYHNISVSSNYLVASGGDPASPQSRLMSFNPPFASNNGSVTSSGASFVTEGFAVGQVVAFSGVAQLDGLAFVLRDVISTTMTFELSGDAIPQSISNVSCYCVGIVPPNGAEDGRTLPAARPEWDAEGVFRNVHIRITGGFSGWGVTSGPPNKELVSTGQARSTLFEGFNANPVTGDRTPRFNSFLSGSWRKQNLGVTDAEKYLPADAENNPYVFPTVGGLETTYLNLSLTVAQVSGVSGTVTQSTVYLTTTVGQVSSVSSTAIKKIVPLSPLTIAQSNVLGDTGFEEVISSSVSQANVVTPTLTIISPLPSTECAQSNDLVSTVRFSLAISAGQANAIAGALTLELSAEATQSNEVSFDPMDFLLTTTVAQSNEITGEALPLNTVSFGPKSVVQTNSVSSTLERVRYLTATVDQSSVVVGNFKSSNVAIIRRRRGFQ